MGIERKKTKKERERRALKRAAPWREASFQENERESAQIPIFSTYLLRHTSLVLKTLLFACLRFALRASSQASKRAAGIHRGEHEAKRAARVAHFRPSRLSFSDFHLRWTLSYLTTGPGPLSAGQPCPQTKKKHTWWAFSSWEHAKAKGGSRSPIFLFFCSIFSGIEKVRANCVRPGVNPAGVASTASSASRRQMNDVSSLKRYDLRDLPFVTMPSH